MASHDINELRSLLARLDSSLANLTTESPVDAIGRCKQLMCDTYYAIEALIKRPGLYDCLDAHGAEATIDNAEIVEDASYIAARSHADSAYSDVIEDAVSELIRQGRLAPRRIPASSDELASFFHSPGVKVVPHEFVTRLVSGGPDCWATADRAIFCCLDDDGGLTVVDNTSGECFVENFNSLPAAVAYIDGADHIVAHGIDEAAGRGRQSSMLRRAQAAAERTISDHSASGPVTRVR